MKVGRILLWTLAVFALLRGIAEVDRRIYPARYAKLEAEREAADKREADEKRLADARETQASAAAAQKRAAEESLEATRIAFAKGNATMSVATRTVPSTAY
jgi:hypothetical protein